MSRFTTHLGLALLEYDNGRPVTRKGLCLWYLRDPLSWEQGEVGSGSFITVPAFDPAGMSNAQLRDIRCRGVTDLGSIPWFARGLIDPSGPEAKAFVLHDDGYVTRGWGGRYSRKAVDELLLEAMKAVGSPKLKRNLIFAAVRAGGGHAWGT